MIFTNIHITLNSVDEIPLEKRVTISSLPERIISGPGSTVNMTCTFHGVDLRNFAVKWSVNGTVLESQPSSIRSHFTLFAVDNSSVLQIRSGSQRLSGDYKCFLQNYPLISSSSNVTFTPGMILIIVFFSLKTDVSNCLHDTGCSYYIIVYRLPRSSFEGRVRCWS